MRCFPLRHLLAGVVLVIPLSAAAQVTITTLDSAGFVGEFSDVAYGPDGLALISYYDQTNDALKVAHCQDVACTTATLATLDAPGTGLPGAGRYTSIAFGSDGLGLISYNGWSGGMSRVKVAHCADAACSSATTALAGPAGEGLTGIAVGADGLGIVGYSDGSGKLAIAHCSDVSCSSLTVASFPDQYAEDVSVSILGDGLPFVVASYAQVAMFHCQNVDCTALGSPQALAGTGGAYPMHASVATGADGLGVLGVDGFVGLPPVAGLASVDRCSNAACSTQTGHVVGVVEARRPSVAMLPGDRPVVAFQQEPALWEEELWLARCPTPQCFTAAPDLLDTGLFFGSYGPSVAVSPQGGVLVSYAAAGGDLKVAYLPPEPAPGNADLALAIVASPDPASPGVVLSYTLTVTNNGPQSATGVQVLDQLPAGLKNPFVDPVMCDVDSGGVVCGLGTLPIGESRSVTISGTPEASNLETLVDQGSVSHSGTDANPANDTATLVTAVNPWLRILETAVVEGTGGTSSAVFQALLSRPSTGLVSVSYTTTPITATVGVDYVTTSGTLSFAPGTVSASFEVPIVTDSVVEDDELFRGILSSPQGAGLGIPFADATILDDDAPSLSRAELSHGSVLATDLAPGHAQAGVAYFRFAAAPYSSYEVQVDAVSPDVAPIHLVRLGPDGLVVQMADEIPGSARLPWTNYLPLTVENETLRVTGACAAACNAGDRYRIRFDDTTLSVPRFNNAGGQTSVLIVSNPTASGTGVILWFFDESGSLLLSTPLQSLQPRGSLVLDTSAEWAQGLLVGRSGSVRITSFAPYGALTGKSVILDPVSGIQSETPAVVRPR
jgi:uncharacterized repeat protein (TIGR01451 family)